MNLEQIPDQVCPICGASYTEERRGSRHCNGQWNEYRTFACGLTLHFSPNYGRAAREGECCHDPLVAERNQKREALKECLLKLVKKADIDPSFKARLLSEIEDLNWERKY